MVRKRVWLGIFLMLVVFIPFVYAYNSGFVHSEIYRSTPTFTDLEQCDKDNYDFKSEFLDKYNVDGFSDSTDSIVTTSEIFDTNGHFHDRKNGWYMSQDYNWGSFSYAYIYVLDKITTVHFQVYTQSDDNREAYCADAGVMWFLIPHENKLDKNLTKDQLSILSFRKMCPSTDPCDSDDGGDTKDTDFDRSTDPLEPGIYFVMIGLGGHNMNNINRLGWESSLKFTKFNDEENYALNTLSSIKNRFIVTTAPLNKIELNTVFTKSDDFNLVENTSWLCNAAGGQMFTDVNSDFKYNSTNKYLEYNGGNTGFNISHLCCGNNDSEFYAFNYTLPGDDINTTYVCENNAWTTGTNNADICKTLIEEPEGFSYDNYYMQSLNEDNVPYYKIQSTPAGTDGCCGDDSYADYGYINPGKQFMCYDVNRDITDPLFNWTNAALDKYYIKTIYKNVSGTIQEVDAISNSKDWYYCDATNTDRLTGGVRVGEGKTFANTAPNNKFSCADMISVLVGGVPFADSCNGLGPDGSNDPPYTSACCQNTTEPSPVYRNDIVNCNMCYLPPIGKINPYAYLPIDSNPTYSYLSSGPVDKDWCVLYPEGCLNNTLSYNRDLNCSQQPTIFNNELCDNSTHVCVGGMLLDTHDSTANKKCCFGEEAQCKLIPTDIESDQNCTDFGGKTYPSSDMYSCSYSIPYGTPTKYCCIGILSFDFSYTITFAVSNNSFLCFKEDNNDMFSQCCYDSTCRNTVYSPENPEIKYFNRRVLTKGSSIHTLNNYDELTLTGPNSLIKDLAYKYIIDPVDPDPISDFPERVQKINLNSFSYLEFDMLTDSNSMSLRVSDVDVGNLSKYMIGNSNRSYVWHHVIIPLNSSPLNNVNTLTNLQFYDSYHAVKHSLILDNIQLTANYSNKDNTTKNYYCTGGFSSWIDDLDSKFEPEETFTYEDIAPYKFACNGLATFGWTGTQCCGDDTKLVNYGEFFNDTDAGCFNGSKIENNERLSDVLGVLEFADLTKDQLQNFEYADLLYFNDSFIGCQVTDTKYLKFNTSYNGSNKLSTLIVNSTKQVKDQCVVVGDYYCMNGVWRKKILTNENLNLGQEFPNGDIQLKMAPAGPDLIRNGFREGCSPTPEQCDGLDNDCNFKIDDTSHISYHDSDGDHLGDPTDIFTGCRPENYVNNDDDCDDTNPLISAAAPEICDSLDNNCNIVVDEGCDDDGDSYADSSMTCQASQFLSGRGLRFCSSNANDCDDTNSSINPTATEICDSLDNNCDGQTDEGCSQ